MTVYEYVGRIVSSQKKSLLADIEPAQMTTMLRDAGHREVAVLAFERKRYVGAQIGIHGPTGQRVGEVRRLRNVEYLFVAGDPDPVEAATAAATGHGSAVSVPSPPR